MDGEKLAQWTLNSAMRICIGDIHTYTLLLNDTFLFFHSHVCESYIY